MLSRVAESIFWMGRYMERAENVARFVDVNLNLSLDLPVSAEQQWRPLVDTTGDDDLFRERYGQATRENVLRFLTFDAENANSILSCLRGARENARSVRESITSEMWEQVNTFYWMVMTAASEARWLESPHEFLSEFKKLSQQHLGIVDATLSRGEGWHFARLGRLIERADKTSRILDVKYYLLLPDHNEGNMPYEDIQWSAVLHSASGFEMYRKRFGRLSPDRVVEFLVLDREFPRAIQYCVMKADDSLHAITGKPAGTFENRAERRLGQLRADLAFIDVADILKDGLHAFVDSLQRQLNDVGEAIHESFFALRPIGSMALAR